MGGDGALTLKPLTLGVLTLGVLTLAPLTLAPLTLGQPQPRAIVALTLSNPCLGCVACPGRVAGLGYGVGRPDRRLTPGCQP